jgi:hypothetical protein
MRTARLMGTAPDPVFGGLLLLQQPTTHVAHVAHLVFKISWTQD